MINLCPKLIAKAVVIDDEPSIKLTMKLLSIAKKLKIRKFGLNTFNDPALINVHKKWPFDEDRSIFSTTQDIEGWPAVWKANKLLSDWIQETFGKSNYVSGGVGNHMQHQLSTIRDNNYHTIKFITGIYTLSKDKQSYDFVETIPYKETAEYKRKHKKNESYF